LLIWHANTDAGFYTIGLREIPKVKFRSIGLVDGVAAGVNLELKASSALRHATLAIGEDIADNVPVLIRGTTVMDIDSAYEGALTNEYKLINCTVTIGQGAKEKKALFILLQGADSSALETDSTASILPLTK